MRSSATHGTDPDVVVIGAGPSGLFAAAELARHGVVARVLDRLPAPHHQTRATAIQPGTLELLARAGLVEDVLAASVHVRFARVVDADLKQVSELPYAGIGCPWEFQCSLPQWRTEQILAERLAQLGVVVERGVAASSIEERDDGVLIQLERDDGTSTAVEAAWVIGAGGAHSIIEASMAETLEGFTYPGTVLAADVRVRCGLAHDASNMVATPDGFVLLAPLPDDRWLTFVGVLDDDELAHLTRTNPAEVVAAGISRRIAADVAVEDVGWATSFHMHQRVVPRLAEGRRFLLGDAGHLSSPFGGEGLNAGLHDAQDIAWKLGLAVHGRARPAAAGELRDRAARRRPPRARGCPAGSTGMVRAAVEARYRRWASPATPAQRLAMARSRCLLDITYAGSPLVGEHLGPDAAPFRRAPATATPLGRRSPGRRTTS